MSRQHPIWNEVTACKYKSGKSFGFTNTGEINVKVGSSRSNSHDFVDTIVTRRFCVHEKYGDVCVFKFSVDGIVLKEMIFKDNKGKAGDFIKTRSKLKSLKSL